MKCPNCDAEIDDGAKFCDYCGKPVQAAAAGPAAAAAPLVQPASPVHPAPGVLDAPEPEPSFMRSEAEPAFSSSPPYSPPAYSPQAQSYTPPGDPFAPAKGGKVLGLIDANQAGLVAIIAGAVGLLFSCVGCGGLFGIFGLIVGILGLKTPDRQKSMIGLILSALSIVVALGFACLVLFSMFSSNSGGYYYPY